MQLQSIFAQIVLQKRAIQFEILSVNGGSGQHESSPRIAFPHIFPISTTTRPDDV